MSCFLHTWRIDTPPLQQCSVSLLKQAASLICIPVRSFSCFCSSSPRLCAWGAKAPSSAQISRGWVRLGSRLYLAPLVCDDLTVFFFFVLLLLLFCTSSCCLRLESQLVSDIQTILQLLQRQTTPGPPAYSTVTSSPDYHRPAMKVQPVPLITSHLFGHAGNQVSNTKEEKWMHPNHCCSIT